MPYKEGKWWRGKIQNGGKRYTKRFGTKKAAADWESEKRRELKLARGEIPTGCSLLEISTKYLEYCERTYSQSTFTGKRKALKELMAATGNIRIEDVTPDDILHGILMKQKTAASANSRRKWLMKKSVYTRL